jgi:hypothetical protein
MKQVIFSTLLITWLVATTNAQSTFSKYKGKTWEQINGNGKMVTLAPVVGGFSVLNLNHLNAKVVVETGTPDHSMSVSIDENLEAFFRYKKEGQTLTLYFDLSGGKYDRWLGENHTVVHLRVPDLTLLNNNGNTSIDLQNLNQPTFSLVSSGNPDIKLAGKVDVMQLETKGNSEINAASLLAQSTELRSSGNADIILNTKELSQSGMSGNNEIINVYGRENPLEEVSTPSPELISFKLYNNSLLPAKLTVISYRPDEKGNGTEIFFLPPLGSKKYNFPVGTKIYLASQQQVDIVMSGASIAGQTPFLVVKKTDQQQTVNINQ